MAFETVPSRHRLQTGNALFHRRMRREKFRDLPDRGLTINRCEVAGLASRRAATCEAVCSLRKAPARDWGLPLRCAPDASARYSRERETAIRISIAARGAIKATERFPPNAPPSSSSLRPPPLSMKIVLALSPLYPHLPSPFFHLAPAVSRKLSP